MLKTIRAYAGEIAIVSIMIGTGSPAMAQRVQMSCSYTADSCICILNGEIMSPGKQRQIGPYKYTRPYDSCEIKKGEYTNPYPTTQGEIDSNIQDHCKELESEAKKMGLSIKVCK